MVLTTADKTTDSKQNLLAGHHEPPYDSPPAYNTAQPSSSTANAGQPQLRIRPKPQPQYVHYQATPIVQHYHSYVPPVHVRLHERPCKRFIKAFVLAIVVWILLSTLIRRGHIGFDRFTGSAQPTAPRPSDGTVVACYGHAFSADASGSEWEDQPGHGARRTKSTLKLPLSTDDSLFFLTRGNSASGNIIFDEGETAGATVDVEWDPHTYSMASNPHLFQVCTLERHDRLQEATGLGVYMPDWARGGSHWSRFRVTLTITLPPGHLKNLKTETSNYAHDLRLSDEVVFDTVDLKGSNGAIIAQNLTADTIAAATSNARIVGSYTASDRLSLTTSNGLIDASVNLDGPSLILRTSNAAIKGTARLTAPNGRSAHRREVILKASNGVIDWTLATLPIGAQLSLDARTSNSQAHLTLPSTYEGRIQQSTSNAGTPTLDVDVRRADPDRRGREYVVTSVSSGKRERTDHVSWGGERASGQVKFSSSNGRVGVRVVDGE
ncbi:hypothetical protein BKA62DRAFT_776426 [Auriculariales sp. MPI-PUGE-AT-0066]|nr:hypothetical protein BKA62DRAFT_776426 [Auriculariales sp. MPI-PUGE-AT-0066]